MSAFQERLGPAGNSTLCCLLTKHTYKMKVRQTAGQMCFNCNYLGISILLWIQVISVFRTSLIKLHLNVPPTRWGSRCARCKTNNIEETCFGMFTELCHTPHIPMVEDYLHGTGLHLGQTSPPSAYSPHYNICFISSSCDHVIGERMI